MKSTKYILESVKKKFGVKEKYEEEGFPDMNYFVGNTSGLDVGNIPTPLDRRVGSQSQLGGSVMEVKVSNPATFSLEKKELVKAIDQLGIDITLHSDMNMGYASAYKTRGQQGVGFETVHQYFTNYLNELAKFKKEVEEREDLDFQIGRINPHTSVSPMPPLQERMAADVGLDPFGFTWTELDRDDVERRNKHKKNIYANKEFLKRFYHTFIKNRTVDQKWRLFAGRQGVFTNYSDKFDRIFRDAQRRASDKLYRRGLENVPEEEELQTRVALVSTAGRADVGVESEWLEAIEEPMEETFENIQVLDENENPAQIPRQDPQNPQTPQMVNVKIDKIETLQDVNDILPMNVRVTRLGTLSEAIHRIENEDWEISRQSQLSGRETFSNIENSRAIRDAALNTIRTQLEYLWRGNGDNFLISVQGKRQALTNHLDIEQQRIFELALSEEAEDPEDKDGEMTLDEAAEKVLTNEEGFFQETEDNRNLYDEMLRTLMGNFEQMIWMESNIFYFILPCWMKVASEENDEHKGWDAPEFIWEVLVERKWDEEYDGEYDIDLTEPDKDNGYFDALEEETEFQMDVSAAVGACYVWGHFTQVESSYHIGDEYEFVDEPEDFQGNFTWVEWMNEFGIGVNFEAMMGSFQQILKVWRPKDIVTAARAINITARSELGKIHEDLDESIAKFTIDMEHVASFGADPWDEMKILIEQEEDVVADVDYDAQVDSDKPLAKVLRQYHLMKPGVDTQDGTRHGPWHRGEKQMYIWLYKLVEAGFARNPGEAAAIMYEQAEEKAETTFMSRIAMNMIELGIKPDEVDPSNVSPGEEYSSEREALIARFFGMDLSSFNREWTKIEEHAFDPLKGLLEAEEFDYTHSSRAATENENRPATWQDEEYR